MKKYLSIILSAVIAITCLTNGWETISGATYAIVRR